MMKKTTLGFLLLASLGLCGQYGARLRVDRDTGTCPGDVCSSAQVLTTATQYTGWTHVDQMQKVTFEITFVDDSDDSVTALTTQCWSSDNNKTANGTGFEICSVGVAAGTGTRTCPYVETLTTGAAEQFPQSWKNIPHDYINCLYTATGAPAAGDTLLVGVKRRNY